MSTNKAPTYGDIEREDTPAGKLYRVWLGENWSKKGTHAWAKMISQMVKEETTSRFKRGNPTSRASRRMESQMAALRSVPVDTTESWLERDRKRTAGVPVHPGYAATMSKIDKQYQESLRGNPGKKRASRPNCSNRSSRSNPGFYADLPSTGPSRRKAR